MDRQIANKNNSDGRDTWWQCHEQGKLAYRIGIAYESCNYLWNSVKAQEWRQGWKEMEDRDESKR